MVKIIPFAAENKKNTQILPSLANTSPPISPRNHIFFNNISERMFWLQLDFTRLVFVMRRLNWELFNCSCKIFVCHWMEEKQHIERARWQKKKSNFNCLLEIIAISGKTEWTIFVFIFCYSWNCELVVLSSAHWSHN